VVPFAQRGTIDMIIGGIHRRLRGKLIVDIARWMPNLNHAPHLEFLACWDVARSPSIRPSGSVCVNSLCNALGIDLPRRRRIGAHGPAAQGPDGIRPSATARNSAPSGQLVGS